MYSLTVTDCLALLEWVEQPTLLPHWEPDRQRWMSELADSAARHVGRVGRRLGDRKITFRLLELLKRPSSRDSALEGLIELADSAAFDGLLECLGDKTAQLMVCVAIGASATPEQIDRPKEVATSATTPEIRAAAADAVKEWNVVRQEREFYPLRSAFSTA